MKWKPELILNGLKIVSMKIEHMFIDSVSYLPMPLRKLPEAFGLSVTKSWYPHYLIQIRIWTMSDPFPTYRIMESMRWRVFDNKLVLEKYCHDDVTVLRQACHIFRRELIEIYNIEVFLESFTIASACNKVLRKNFWNQIPSVWYPTVGIVVIISTSREPWCGYCI